MRGDAGERGGRARLAITALGLGLWALLALVYVERHAPASAGGWAVLAASCGAAATLLAGLVALVARWVVRRSRR